MTDTRTTDAARDPWRSSLRASRERRAAARRAHRWTVRRRSVAALACATMAFGSGAAIATTGGTTAGSSGGSSTSDESARSSSNTLRPGSRGAAVKKLQRKLRLRADGHYGSATKRAVKRYQKRKGIRADGIAGPETLRMLRIRLSASNTGSDDSGSVEVPEELQRIAQCESGGNPKAISPDGKYRGKYQFDMDTWASIGGEGDPADAPESTQDRLAVKLYNQRGTAPWPNCSGS